MKSNLAGAKQSIEEKNSNTKKLTKVKLKSINCSSPIIMDFYIKCQSSFNVKMKTVVCIVKKETIN